MTPGCPKPGASPYTLGAAALLAPYLALGVDASPAAAPPAPSQVDDRISLSADGSTLTNTNGGGGAAAGWLHNFDAQTLAGLAVEHQVLASAQWTFASINGSVTRTLGDASYGLYGEAHEGDGDDASHPFKYRIEAAGISGTFFHRLSAQLEDRRIDIETTHGNLPKLGLSYLWNPRLQTAISYAYTASGNLGTRLTAVRIDEYGSAVNFLAGGAFGQASPAVLNEEGELLVPGHTLREGYFGVVKPVARWRSDLSLVFDYINLSGSKRATLTLNYTFHLGHAGQSP
jgi:hypothetical protein